MREPFLIGGHEIKAGTRATIELGIPSLYTHTALEMPVQVIHGKKPGPVMFLSAAVHGDEINGVEIIRRVLNVKSLNRIKGILIAIPVVNVFGFINQSRYLPDRRDLNRSFPGSKQGSMAARMAHLFINEIVSKSTHGIDLHTGAIHRENLPQVRAILDDEVTESSFITSRRERSPLSRTPSLSSSTVLLILPEVSRFNRIFAVPVEEGEFR